MWRYIALVPDCSGRFTSCKLQYSNDGRRFTCRSLVFAPIVDRLLAFIAPSTPGKSKQQVWYPVSTITGLYCSHACALPCYLQDMIPHGTAQ